MNLAFKNSWERSWLREYTRKLTDPTWINHAHSFCIGEKQDYFLYDVINLFFDDTHFSEQPEDHLGESLLDEEEVATVRRMVVALGTLMTACEGLGLTDAEYLKRPEWSAVHEAAKDLHALIVTNDARIAAA